jgi:hypothetical protein
MLVKIAWAIVADGTLFKGAFVVFCETQEGALEKARAALGQEGNAANFTVKAVSQADCLDIGRSEYPADRSKGTNIPHVSAPPEFTSRSRFLFDLAARANVIAEDEESAFRKLGHSLAGKEVFSVKYLRTTVSSSEPYEALSNYERHLIEKQFRSIRVAST